jgi:hypothetical protein
MTKNNISYKELYELVDKRTSEIMAKFDVLEVRVSTLETWRSNIKFMWTTMGAVLVFVVNFVGNWLYDRFVRGRG